MRQHVKSVHKGLKYDCNMCELKFSYPHGVSSHKKRAHFKEKVYGAKTLTETVFTMMTELETGWKCIQCGKEQRNKSKKISKSLLKMHIESEHMGILHTCEMCGQMYKTKDTYRHHIQTSDCNVKNLPTVN